MRALTSLAPVLSLYRLANVPILVPGDIGPTGIEETGDRADISGGTLLPQLPPHSAPNVLGQGKVHLGRTLLRPAMVFGVESYLSSYHHDGAIITSKIFHHCTRARTPICAGQGTLGAISAGSPPGIQCASAIGGVSRRYHSASRAPLQPLPAAVIAWR